MTRICITDDHQLVLEGIKLLLQDQDDLAIVGLCRSSSELLDFIKNTHIDIVLLDINLPDQNGIETCKYITKHYPAVKVIGLSMIGESNLIKLMLKNGALGYLHKNAGKSEIVKAIHDVKSGQVYISKEMKDILIGIADNNVVNNTPFPKLSSREVQILKMITNEKTTQEIADTLFISFGTVETHRRNIMIKLGVKNTAGLVRIAIEYNLTN